MSAFDGIDFTTPQGAKLRAVLEARLQELRTRNDDPGLPERETHNTRGAITEVKRLLAGAAPLVPLQSYSVRPNTGGTQPW